MTTYTLTPASTSPWTVPAGVLQVQVECWGSGGGGGPNTGHGGGGGAYAKKNVYAVTPGANINFTCPAGAIYNTAGADCWFASTSVVLAKGGGKGEVFSGTGLGGAATSCVGDVKFSGGNSGTTDVDIDVSSTGGGSSAGTGAAGNNALSETSSPGATAPTGGGNGGNGGVSATAGAVPGGGGGGDAAHPSTAPSGGNAQIIITDTTAVLSGPVSAGWW